MESAPAIPVVKLKTFGEFGPCYEIMGPAHQRADGDWVFPIRVIRTGEELDYPYDQLASDPDAVYI